MCVVSLSMSDAEQVVAVIGLGTMGSAMARRIHAAGHEIVVWNRDRAKAEALTAEVDAAIAPTAADAAAAAGTVITSLADDAAVEAVYLGPAGIAAGIRAGSIAVDTSTVDPDTILKVGNAIDAAGAGFFDCPVSGSVTTISNGALTMMAGDEGALVTRVEPILASMAQRVIRVGPRGSGAACKLAVNGMLHSLNVALSEALVLAEKAGVARSTAYEVFVSGAGGAPFVHYKRNAYENPETAPVDFDLEMVVKDLELITGLGRKVGAPMNQAETGLGIVRAAIAAGLGKKDLSAIAVYLRGKEQP
jgi:3-hydroxyisobutyrate dehydrogenase-like beta-hydroxyacid dehydrogenase